MARINWKHLGLITLLLSISACNNDKDTPQSLLKPPALAGIFEQKGYGRVAVFSQSNYEFYQVLDQHCWRTEQGALAELQMSAIQFADKGQQLSFKIPAAQSFPIVLTRMNRLPEHCRTPLTPTMDPLQNFEVFYQAIAQLYAFFPERQINWQQRYQAFLPKVSAQLSDEALFAVMVEMLADFNDSHVSLTAELGGSEVQFNAAPANVISELAELTGQAEQEIALAIFGQSMELMQLYAGSPLQQALPEQPLWWAKSADNVGYILLAGLAGYSSDHGNPSADLQQASAAFQKMMMELSDTEALIIDNRFNRGGYDDIGSELVRHFLTKPQAVLQRQVKNGHASTQPQILNLDPTSHPFTKPVYVINSALSVSAAETLSVMLKDLPQVTLLGEPTNGALSDILEIPLPNGWLLTLSNETYMDMQGNRFEVSGVAPDIETTVFSQQDFELLRVPAYDIALAKLGKHFALFDFAQLEQRITAALTDGILPGIAIAAVKQEQIIFSRGFGMAQEGVAVTADTPFFLASVSKAFNGTLAAILEAKDHISLDASLANILTLPLSTPAQDQQPILFRHLLSHTSGILDSEVFLCGYFLSENGDSLYNLLTESGVCPEPVYQPLEEFLANYLTATGNRYLPANYNSDPSFQPGTTFVYSNIGTAAAAAMMAQATGLPYEQLFEQELALPLQLLSTRWDPLGNSLPEVASRFLKTDNGFIAYPSYSANSWPDGYLTASANDLAKFSTLVMSEQHPLLTEQVQQKMFSPLVARGFGQGGGYFWDLDHHYAGHTGSDPGVSSLLLLDRSNRNALVILINTDNLQDNNPALDQFLKELKLIGWHAIWSA